MLKILGFIFLMISVSEAVGQKVLQKEIDAQFIKEIIVNGDGIFKIKVISEERKTIEMLSEIEGEYAVNTLLTYTESNEILTIGSGYSPYFKKENDKLSAHKIESVSLLLTIPEGLEITILSDIANLEMDGRYNFVDVSLENGNCIISNFIGNANLVTKDGDIQVTANAENVSGILFSKLGKEINELPEGNRFMIEAYTLRGNIALQQTEN